MLISSISYRGTFVIKSSCKKTKIFFSTQIGDLNAEYKLKGPTFFTFFIPPPVPTLIPKLEQ